MSKKNGLVKEKERKGDKKKRVSKRKKETCMHARNND